MTDVNLPSPFIIDPVQGETLTYGDLWRRLSDPRERAPVFCRPTRLSDVFVGLVTALAADTEITLVDSDFSPDEQAALGIDASSLTAVAERPAVHVTASLSDTLSLIRERSTGRIRLFTSGSTGMPKAVTHSLANLCRAVRVNSRHSEDIWGFAYNPTHIAGVQVFLQALFNQNPLVNVFQLPRDRVRELIKSQGVTHLSATPSFYRLLLPADDPLDGVRSVTLGGERTDAALIEKLRRLFPEARFRNLYASTEAGTLLTADADVFSIPGDWADRIRVTNGQLEVHRDLLGEFAAAGAAVGDWYATGDVVELVSEQPLRFRIVSRDRDWINVGGNKVNPAEVESALLEHPAVRDARVFGRPNSVLGQLLCAEVVPIGAAPAEAELRRFLSERLQVFKLPRLVRFASELSRTRTGKLKRDE